MDNIRFILNSKSQKVNYGFIKQEAKGSFRVFLKKAVLLPALIFISSISAYSQITVTGKIVDSETGNPITAAELYINGEAYTADKRGSYQIKNLPKKPLELLVFSFEYEPLKTIIDPRGDTTLNLQLDRLSNDLSEVVIRTQREEHFALRRLKPVDGTAIFAGKKNEVVLMDQLVANLAANNSRQIYGQVVGLNIYESNDGGLQLSIGGRGLNPNRTANFNTRQNGYDISADVLGYPESYYTPPAEALEEIQVVRGAASLQYGTQFGGLVNFKMKRPNPYRKIEWTSRQTVGSFGLFTSFNSLSGTIGKVSYYGYFNYKRGDGYRPNSGFNSANAYVYVAYQYSPKTKFSFETTYLDYLAEQAGGLTDPMFAKDPRSSNRSRNYFGVDWRLYSLKINHSFNEQTELDINFFGLNATRDALGFRGIPSNLNSNPITEVDEQEPDGSFVYPRDLIKGKFRNWGIETRLLRRYKFWKKDAVMLVGVKLYKARNSSVQGPGSKGTAADFSIQSADFPDYPNQSEFLFPNFNAALFGEHIFNLSDKLSVTPGFRAEYINTKSEGFYTKVNFDNAGNPISNQRLVDNRSLKRQFVLLGIGLEYKLSQNSNFFANISQNYRSVTFSDIRTVSPTFIIDPNIQDEKGFTSDLGYRGSLGKKLSFDVGGFGLLYNNRIGIILDDRANRVRKNIGKAFIYGIESLVDWNIANTLFPEKTETRLNWFLNTALTDSKYLASEESNVTGNKVEFIPLLNLKTGLRFGYKDLYLSGQWTYLGQQYTDVQNSGIPEDGDVRNGLVGEIPAYGILDISLSYTLNRWKLETGINNVLNRQYFTRRATGYPGPGIIPSDGRGGYLTVALKL